MKKKILRLVLGASFALAPLGLPLLTSGCALDKVVVDDDDIGKIEPNRRLKEYENFQKNKGK